MEEFCIKRANPDDGLDRHPELEPVINQPDSLKSEHLNCGEKPLMVCAVNDEHLIGLYNQDDTLVRYVHAIEEGLFVEYGRTFNDSYEEKIKTFGANTYFISPIDAQNKYSKEFYDCTGLIVSGRRKTDGEYVSFLTHQDPKRILDKMYIFSFENDLKGSLKELKNECQEGTIDAICLGGMYNSDKDTNNRYLKTINIISKNVLGVLGFEPVFVGGPKSSGFDNVFLDNKERRVFLIRNNDEKFHPSFVSSNVPREFT